MYNAERRQALALMFSLLDKEIVRAELNSPIKFTKAGLKEALNQPHPDYTEKAKLLANPEALISDIISSRYIGSAKDIKNRSHITEFYYFESENLNNQYVVYKNARNNCFYLYTITAKNKKP